jgi:hypothetical protein
VNEDWKQAYEAAKAHVAALEESRRGLLEYAIKTKQERDEALDLVRTIMDPPRWIV